MCRQIDRETEKQTDGRTEGQTDRQIDSVNRRYPAMASLDVFLAV